MWWSTNKTGLSMVDTCLCFFIIIFSSLFFVLFFFLFKCQLWNNPIGIVRHFYVFGSVKLIHQHVGSVAFCIPISRHFMYLFFFFLSTILDFSFVNSGFFLFASIEKWICFCFTSIWLYYFFLFWPGTWLKAIKKNNNKNNNQILCRPYNLIEHSIEIIN